VNFLTSLPLCVKVALAIYLGVVFLYFFFFEGVRLDVVLFRNMMLMVCNLV
jgi:hypothetical protein